MKHSHISLVILAILFSGFVLGPTDVLPERARAQGTPVVGVFSDVYGSSNVTDTSLTPGHQVTFEITVANAPTFNGYEFSLYFDPHFLQFSSSDTRTGTVFANPFTVREDTSILGTYSLVVVAVPGTNTAADGPLVHINFNIIGVGVSPLVLAAGMETHSPSAEDGTWTRLVLGSNPIDVVTADGYFKNDPLHLGPVASFTLTPTTPTGGETVTFDASASFDPDNQTGRGIRLYVWDFGIGGFNAGLVTNRTITTRAFGSPGAPISGNFSVRLTVVDIDNGFEGMVTRLVSVAPPVVHDLGIVISVLPTVVQAGEDVSVVATVRNLGTLAETYNVTIDYGPPTTLLLKQIQQFIPASSRQQFRAILNTAGLPPGAYEVDATVACQCQDSTPSNNLASTVFIVQPRPTLSLTPNNGTLGAQVVVHGSGFPSPQYGPSELFISLDDQFLGFAFPRNGAFNFTFNVPHADPTRPHMVKALDLSTGVTTAAGFHVLPTPPPPGNLAVVVSAGTIYFPGDTSVIYVQATLNGSPVGSGVQLQVRLLKPDGSNTILTWVSVTPGLYKATYTVPKTGSTGTYAIVATASLNGQNAAALASFEVKTPWMASQSGRTTTTGLALVGIVGLVALASWKGYRGRRKGDPVPF